MTTISYHFGVEIEIMAKPHQIRETPLNQLLYWEKLGKALEKRGINVEVDKPHGPYRKNKERYTRGWWITRDGSLVRHQDEIAFEAVSPILNTSNGWEHQIDMFWKAYSKVFHQPRSQSESYCGGHIHVSSSSQEWSTDQLRNIASGIFHFEHFIEDMIPASRQNNQFCKKNSANSRFLRSCRGNPRKFFEKISDASRGEIWGLMQNDRKVLWNFAHVVKGGTGSIEFRGGRCFRGPQRTKAWIAFAVGYMHLLQGMPFWEYKVHRREVYSTEVLYEKIKASASKFYMDQYLPPRYTQLNESESWSE
ncbi:hypothetical protein WHR41_06756 [Cladosporium halotolerans]|uniref:Swim zinc finger domain protein n=1 Tax=Cladosporium halotolerans TaxID=1052096 RepID=A0AB34KHS7_9PEZI